MEMLVIGNKCPPLSDVLIENVDDPQSLYNILSLSLCKSASNRGNRLGVINDSLLAI